jgi:hypothetical protein
MNRAKADADSSEMCLWQWNMSLQVQQFAPVAVKAAKIDTNSCEMWFYILLAMKCIIVITNNYEISISRHYCLWNKP